MRLRLVFHTWLIATLENKPFGHKYQKEERERRIRAKTEKLRVKALLGWDRNFKGTMDSACHKEATRKKWDKKGKRPHLERRAEQSSRK